MRSTKVSRTASLEGKALLEQPFGRGEDRPLALVAAGAGGAAAAGGGYGSG